jgi:hypothetical protein
MVQVYYMSHLIFLGWLVHISIQPVNITFWRRSDIWFITFLCIKARRPSREASKLSKIMSMDARVKTNEEKLWYPPNKSLIFRFPCFAQNVFWTKYDHSVFLNIARRDAKNLKIRFLQAWSQVCNKMCKLTFKKIQAYLRDQTLNLAQWPFL